MATGEAPAAVRLVAGLGNPGARYRGTRHNIGFDVLDCLAARLGAGFSRSTRWKADLTRAGELHLLKPATYMNLSGESAGSFARFHRIEPGAMLVVVDDVNLPLGRLRLRPGGSAGGHNGLQSLIDHLGTADFPRLRIGVGSAGDGSDLVDHVLGRFEPAEAGLVGETIQLAADAVEAAIEKGVAAAMNIYNKERLP